MALRLASIVAIFLAITASSLAGDDGSMPAGFFYSLINSRTPGQSAEQDLTASLTPAVASEIKRFITPTTAVARAPSGIEVSDVNKVASGILSGMINADKVNAVKQIHHDVDVLAPTAAVASPPSGGIAIKIPNIQLPDDMHKAIGDILPGVNPDKVNAVVEGVKQNPETIMNEAASLLSSSQVNVADVMAKFISPTASPKSAGVNDESSGAFAVRGSAVAVAAAAAFVAGLICLLY